MLLFQNFHQILDTNKLQLVSIILISANTFAIIILIRTNLNRDNVHSSTTTFEF